MATRNLTDEFVTMRLQRRQRSNSGALSSSNSGALLGEAPSSSDDYLAGADSGRSGVAVNSTLPPSWVDTVDEVERCMGTIESRLDALRELHRKRLMVTFDADDTESSKDREIDQAAKGVTSLMRQAERKIKAISDSTDYESSATDAKLRANIVRNLASRLQQVSVDFRRTQKDFLRRRADQKKGADGFEFLGDMEAGGASASGTGLVSLTEGQTFTVEQLAVVDDMEREIAQRDKEIGNIVDSIEELSQIFKELAVLVIDQGTILDRIDYNMELAVERVEDGVLSLEKAEEYQKSARPRYCIALLLILIGVMLTLLILKHQDNNNDDD